MKKNTLAMLLLSISIAAAGCSKNPQIATPEQASDVSDNSEVKDNASTPEQASDVSGSSEAKDNASLSEQASDVSDCSETSKDNASSEPDKTVQDASDKIPMNFCSEGNCPCGNGFCSKNSYCIIDACICGTYESIKSKKEILNIREHAIASNKYGEFECFEYVYTPECDPNSLWDNEACPASEYYYDYICNRDEGCKIADGRKYPKSKNVVDYYSVYKKRRDLHISKGKNLNLSHYTELVEEQNLKIECGNRLSEKLKILDRHGNGKYRTIRNSDQYCDIRKACNDIGVTQNHINEYVCDVGKEFYMDSPDPYNDAFREMPIGLRCNQPDGCTCGKTHCPHHALCQNGSCQYDLYYQDHSCPGVDWDPKKSDAINHILAGACKKEIEERFEYLDKDSPDYERNKNFIYEDCYWSNYTETIRSKDPCIKKP